MKGRGRKGQGWKGQCTSLAAPFYALPTLSRLPSRRAGAAGQGLSHLQHLHECVNCRSVCTSARPDGPCIVASQRHHVDGGGGCVHAPVGLTARRPDLMAHALSLHNGIMELAKDDNCGSIIRQEGGESVCPPDPGWKGREGGALLTP